MSGRGAFRGLPPAANKQKLAQYTWTEIETISIKGNVKDTKTYQVQMVNGQQQKTEVSNQ